MGPRRKIILVAKGNGDVDFLWKIGTGDLSSRLGTDDLPGREHP